MTPLESLSELIGVEVDAVERDPEPRIAGHFNGRPLRQQDVFGKQVKRGWTLRVRGRSLYISSSDELRSPAQLNVVARRLGRDPALPRLSARDGRALLKLLHQTVETTPATPGD